MHIPESIQHFITTAPPSQNACLPHHYPRLDEWDKYQDGFRIHGITREDLTSTKEGSWQPGWYVIAMNAMDDPFFIDLSEEEKKFPIYFAWHGAGRWDRVEVAPSLDAFVQLLKQIGELEDQKEACLSLLEKQVDIKNEFWKEVYDSLAESEDDVPSEPVDMSEWIPGSLVITGAGPNKMKVVQYLREQLLLSPTEALAMIKQPQIVVKKGYLQHLKYEVNKLLEMGAEASFRAD